MIPLFLANIILVVGSAFSTIGGIGFSIYYNSLDFFDYPMTRYFYKFNKKLSVTIKKLMLSMGFGNAEFLFILIPFINVIFRPLLVVSGTAFFFEKKYGER